MSAKNNIIHVIGGGLAGVEASYYLACRGIHVRLYEKRLIDYHLSPAHHSSLLGELVCSNSLKNISLDNASGVLKKEMEQLNSLVMDVANKNSVPAGKALAVDRQLFMQEIDDRIRSHPLIEIVAEDVEIIPEGIVIVATGPLTDKKLLASLEQYLTGKGHFFDASAPLVTKDSLDLSICYLKNRYDEENEGDYYNCPFTKDEFMEFYDQLITAEIVKLKEFEEGEQETYFQACQPIEVLAKKGSRTLTFGPMKPKGLNKDGNKPFAVVQLRQDNVAKSLYSLVGFQTNLTYKEQERVFKMIPGLANAQFMRYGLMHRNTYITSPLSLQKTLNLKKNSQVFIAGQLNGVEGYLESAVTGIICGINALRMLKGLSLLEVPQATITGSLINYITSCDPRHFQPMNANWGIVTFLNNTRDSFYLDSKATLQEWIELHEIFK